MSFNPNGRDSRPVLHASKLYLAGMETDTEVIDIKTLSDAYHNKDHDLNRLIEAPCSVCGQVEFVPALTAGFGWAHDECRAKRIREQEIIEAKRHWEKVCPDAFRDTDRDNPAFPKAILSELVTIWRTTACKTPVVIQGSPKSSKTRLALELAKFAMMQGKTVAVAWPEDLEVAQEKWERVELAKGFSKYDVLVVDEPMTAMQAGPKVAPFIKRILDIMARQGKTWIITSKYDIAGRSIGTQINEQIDGTRSLTEHWNNSKIVSLGNSHNAAMPRAIKSHHQTQDEY